MDDYLVKRTADVLSMYSYKMEALVNVLIKKNIFSKEELNDALGKVMEDAKSEPAADEYVIEELKKLVYVKWADGLIFYEAL